MTVYPGLIAFLKRLAPGGGDGAGFGADGRPFELRLDGASGPAARLHCGPAVRVVPGRRLVCPADWQGRAVYAKLYFGRRARRGWRRELAGLRALHARGLPAPAVVHAATVAAGRIYGILLAPIAPAESALSAWERAADEGARARLLRLLVETVARQHAAGLLQRDLHLRNFLLSQGTLYTLDGGEVEICRRAPGLERSLDNLALLFAQLAPEHDALSEALLPLYCARRGWPVPGREAALERRIARCRRRRRKQYLKKIFRTSSATIQRRDWRRRVIYRRPCGGPALEALLADPDASLHWPGAQRLKDGRTCTLWRVPAGERQWVIKRYNIKHRLHGLERAVRPTRAAVCWENAHRLAFCGIAAAPAVALIEERWGPLRRRAYWISEAVDGSHAREFFAGEPDSARRQETARAIVRLLEQLAACQISHGDLKATNIILGPTGPVLIDLDAARQHRLHWWFRRRRQRDLRRFLRNWRDQPQLAKLFQALLGDGAER